MSSLNDVIICVFNWICLFLLIGFLSWILIKKDYFLYICITCYVVGIGLRSESLWLSGIYFRCIANFKVIPFKPHLFALNKFWVSVSNPFSLYIGIRSSSFPDQDFFSRVEFLFPYCSIWDLSHFTSPAPF